METGDWGNLTFNTEGFRIANTFGVSRRQSQLLLGDFPYLWDEDQIL